jgi:hypothetical protein
MRFPGGKFFQVGWTPYSNTADTELFADDGKGKVLRVEIAHAGATPAIMPIEVGKLEWRDETFRLHHEDDLSKLIDTLARRADADRQLLRLRLEGVLDAHAYLRLDELEGSPGTGGVLSRYCWSEMDKERLAVEPTDEQLRELVGTGVVRRIYDLLNQELDSEDRDEQERAKESLLTLYRLAQECHR